MMNPVAGLVLRTRRGVFPDQRLRVALCLAGLVALTGAGCSSAGGRWFQLGPRPPELAGIWVDSAKATPTDTVAWVLAPTGEDRTLYVRVRPGSDGRPAVTREERRYGYWFLVGRLDDTTRRAICVKRRPRDGETCALFRLDTLAAPSGGLGQRRLRIVGFRGEHHTRDRVLLERR